MQWIATAAFALEGIVARELRDMGAQNVEAQNGAVRFEGDMTAGLRANLWLRCCDRVLLRWAGLRQGRSTSCLRRCAQSSGRRCCP